MADQPYDRTVLHPREKPLSSDLNQAQSDLDAALRFFARQLLGGIDAFVGTGLKVVAQSPAAMAVNVTAGLGFQLNESANQSAIDAGGGPVTGLNDLESFKPLPLLGIETFTVPAAPSAPNTRIDIIEVRADLLVTDPQSRQVLNTSTGKFDPNTLNKALSWALDGRTDVVNAPADSTEPLSYKRGVAANPGVAPATTAGYIKLAQIAVGSAVTAIDDDDITDFRAAYRTGDLWIPAQDMQLNEGEPGLGIDPANFRTAGGIWQSHTSEEAALYVPLRLQVGDRIKAITVYGRAGNLAGEELRASLLYAGTTSINGGQVGANKTSSLANGDTSIGWTVADTGLSPAGHVVVANRAYYLDIPIPATSAAGEVKVYSAHVQLG